MTKQRTVLPEKLEQGEKIRLIDSSWNILFPRYWQSYRETASLINIATVYITKVLKKNRYEVGILDIVPDEGRVVLPIGLKVEVDLRQIHLAIALSYKLANSGK